MATINDEYREVSKEIQGILEKHDLVGKIEIVEKEELDKLRSDAQGWRKTEDLRVELYGPFDDVKDAADWTLAELLNVYGSWKDKNPYHVTVSKDYIKMIHDIIKKCNEEEAESFAIEFPFVREKMDGG